MSALKVHWAIVRRIYGEDRARSLCNRAAPTVINVETLDHGQNLTTDPAKVTCSFCASMIRKRPSLLVRPTAQRGKVSLEDVRPGDKVLIGGRVVEFTS